MEGVPISYPALQTRKLGRSTVATWGARLPTWSLGVGLPLCILSASEGVTHVLQGQSKLLRIGWSFCVGRCCACPSGPSAIRVTHPKACVLSNTGLHRGRDWMVSPGAVSSVLTPDAPGGKGLALRDGNWNWDGFGNKPLHHDWCACGMCKTASRRASIQGIAWRGEAPLTLSTPCPAPNTSFNAGCQGLYFLALVMLDITPYATSSMLPTPRPQESDRHAWYVSVGVTSRSRPEYSASPHHWKTRPWSLDGTPRWVQ